MFHEHCNEFNVLQWPPQSLDLNPIEHLWDVVERETRSMKVQLTNVQKSRDAIMSRWNTISKNCLTSCGIQARKNLGHFESKGARYSISIVFLMVLSVCIVL